MKKLVELKADRRLLEPQFEGYRLAGRGPTARRLALPRPPPRVLPELRSPLHARLALHNALVAAGDDAVAFADDEGGAWLARRDPELRLRRVFAPRPGRAPRPDLPPSLRLLPRGRAVLSAAPGELLLLRAPLDDDDPAEDSWTVEAALDPLGPDARFALLDARLVPEGEDPASFAVHCVLQRIAQKEKRSFYEIDWIVLSSEDGAWRSTPHRRLECDGAVYSCSLETDCRALCVAGDRPPRFVVDDAEAPLAPEVVEPKKKYRWSQTAEYVAATVPLTRGGPDAAPIVNVSRDRLAVSCDGVEYLEGELSATVEAEVATWCVEDEELIISLLKREPNVVWPSLLKDGDPEGEREADRRTAEEVHSRLAPLCSATEVVPENAPLFNAQQLEECDFVAEEESCLVRLDSSTNQISHQAFLSSHQMILTVQSNPSEIPALGLRHDADCCIWQPYATAADGEWNIEHEGTLLAFGYVQSSKQQKKYTVCSPNLEYAVVCESTRHAFIYHQEWTPQKHSQLRRRTPDGDARRVKVGRQQLISFDRDEEVFGICATNEILFILTEKNIIAFEMSE